MRLSIRSLTSFAIALASASFLSPTCVSADSGKALGKFVVLVEKHEFLHSHPRILPRLVAQAACSPVCSVLDSAASTCGGDSCFCPVLTAVGTPCSQCYESVNITAAELLGSAFSICASEFPGGVALTSATSLSTSEFGGGGGITKTSSTTFNTAVTGSVSTSVGLAAACTNECRLINSALGLCVDDACFCPTALSVGSACSSCLMTVDVIQATDLGSALSICQTEFGAGTTPTTTGSLKLPFALGGSTATPTASGSGGQGSETNTQTSSGSSGLSGGAIGGIVGGVVGALAIGAIAMFFLLRRGSGRQPRVQADGQFPPYQPPPSAPQRFSGYSEKVGTGPQTVAAEPIEEEISSGAIKYLDPDETEAHGVFPSAGENGNFGPASGRTGGNY